MISELLRKKAAAAESEAKLQHFTRFVKDRKKQATTTRHKHHWIAEAHKLQKERSVVEAEVQLLCLHVEDPQLEEIVEERDALAAERRELVNDVFSSVMGWKLKVASTGRYAAEDLQGDLGAIKRYLHAVGQELARAEVELQTEIAASRLPWRETAPAEPAEDFAARFDAAVADLEAGGVAADPTLAALLRDKAAERHAESAAQLARLAAEARELTQAAAGWDAAEQERFHKLWKEYGYRGEAGPRSDFLDRLRLEIPTRSAADIHAFWWGQERLRFLRQKQKAARADHAELAAALCANATQALAAAAALQLARDEREQEQQRRQQERAELQAKLLECQTHKREKQERLAAERLQQAAEEEERLRVARERYEEHAKQQLQKLMQYREQEAEEARRLEQIRREEEELEAEQRRRVMERNAQRVTYREDEWERKRQAAEERQRALAAERQQREERLRALAAQVRVEAEADPERLLRPTECFRNREDAEGAADLFRHYGYTADTVARDHRFRLQEALAQAGLLNTDYARQVILSAAPARAPRPGMHSTFAFGGD